jgi:hypothetical protein
MLIITMMIIITVPILLLLRQQKVSGNQNVLPPRPDPDFFTLLCTCVDPSACKMVG